MNWKTEWKPLGWIVALFLLFYYLPVDSSRLTGAIYEALALTKWYAREHVILCLIPAFFIAGAIAVFVSQASVVKYLGAKANKILSYGVASVSGTILAVCSCTVLPLFAGIYRMGAGIGPAIAFLYSGPAINVLAIILTARVLGYELGIARAVGAILFSIVIGLLMHLIFLKEDKEKNEVQMALPEDEITRPLWKNALYFLTMIVILVFATWSKPEETTGFWFLIYSFKWYITGFTAAVFGLILILWFKISWIPLALTGVVTTAIAFIFPEEPLLAFSTSVIGLSIIISRRSDESGDWFAQTYGFAKQIFPLLLGGVLIAGLLLGRLGQNGLIPSDWISGLVGGNSIEANLFASVVGAFMYFATLTEVPILQGLISNGMGKGPALALLLAGPALSLPNMLVIRSIMGTKKTIVFVVLVVIISTVTGIIYGNLF
ncbi:MAG: permease [candidate division Zixibacteria bacterium]|nr:permease [candidate division Zixibacteria bacterium]